MSDLTDFGENAAAQALLGTGTFHISLHTGDPGEDGTANELTVANGYARQTATFTVTNDTAASDAEVQFGPATADQGTITHCAIFTAATAGNCIAKGALQASRAWPSGTLTFAAGQISLTIA